MVSLSDIPLDNLYEIGSYFPFAKYCKFCQTIRVPISVEHYIKLGKIEEQELLKMVKNKLDIFVNFCEVIDYFNTHDFDWDDLLQSACMQTTPDSIKTFKKNINMAEMEYIDFIPMCMYQLIRFDNIQLVEFLYSLEGVDHKLHHTAENIMSYLSTNTVSETSKIFVFLMTRDDIVKFTVKELEDIMHNCSFFEYIEWMYVNKNLKITDEHLEELTNFGYFDSIIKLHSKGYIRLTSSEVNDQLNSIIERGMGITTFQLEYYFNVLNGKISTNSFLTLFRENLGNVRFELFTYLVEEYKLFEKHSESITHTYVIKSIGDELKKNATNIEILNDLSKMLNYLVDIKWNESKEDD